MGVEYAHYLIPEDNTYKPRPEELSRLVDALLDSSFVIRPGSDAFKTMTLDEYTKQTGCYVRLSNREFSPFPCPCSARDVAALEEQDFRLVWPVESSSRSGLKYPLLPFPEWGDAYYDLELHLANDYVYHCSEGIDPFDEVVCGCGYPLEHREREKYELFLAPVYFDSRIYRRCPSCGRPFRPQESVARITNGYTGEVSEQAGGATYLFAVVVDCGKGFARECWPIRASEEFLDTVTDVLGKGFYQIGEFH